MLAHALLVVQRFHCLGVLGEQTGSHHLHSSLLDVLEQLALASSPILARHQLHQQPSR